MVLVAPDPNGPLANSSVCPVGVDATLCEAFSIQGSDGTWFPAVPSLVQRQTGAPGAALVLTAASGKGSGLSPIATASGWSLWPITLLYSAAGLPAFPWNETIQAGHFR